MYNDTFQDDAGGPSPGGFLVVDDVAINIYITRETLLPYGLPVDTAESGIEAVEKIKSGNVYDIIFMDHMMPGMSGIEATQIIRSMGYTGCIVALTANAGEENKRLYVTGGFNRFIVKPVEKEQVDDLIAEFIDMDIDGYDYDDNADGQTGSNLPEITQLFILDAEEAIQTLENICAIPHELTDDEIELYEITFHGMKSALRNINEQDLSNFALQLEQAAKSGDLSVINSRTAVFITDLKQMITALKAAQ